MRGYRFLMSQPINHNLERGIPFASTRFTKETWPANGSNRRGITAILLAPNARARERSKHVEDASGGATRSRASKNLLAPRIPTWNANNTRSMKSNYRSIFTQLVETCLGSWERERENKTFRERTIITTRSTTRTNSFVPPYIYIYVLSKLPFPNLPRFLVPYESIDDHDLPRRNRGWHTSGQCDLPVSDKPTLFASFFLSLPLSSCSRGVDNSPRNSTRFSFRFCHRSNAIQRLD